MAINSVRYFNPYGPRSFNPENKENAYSSVVGIFKNQSLYGKITITGNGEQKRDFIHVYDLVEATILAAEKDVAGEVFNVGCGKNYSINELASFFDCEKVYIPERKGESLITLADITKAKKMLGWNPKYDLKNGIKIIWIQKLNL